MSAREAAIREMRETIGNEYMPETARRRLTKAVDDLELTLASPAPVFGMEAAVEAALKCHFGNEWPDQFVFAGDIRRQTEKDILAALPHLQPDMEALRRELPKGWRVIPYGGHARSQGALCEVYDPTGSGGVVMEGDVRDWVVRKLLTALAQAGKQGGGK